MIKLIVKDINEKFTIVEVLKEHDNGFDVLALEGIHKNKKTFVSKENVVKLDIEIENFDYGEEEGYSHTTLYILNDFVKEQDDYKYIELIDNILGSECSEIDYTYSLKEIKIDKRNKQYKYLFDNIRIKGGE